MPLSNKNQEKLLRIKEEIKEIERDKSVGKNPSKKTPSPKASKEARIKKSSIEARKKQDSLLNKSKRTSSIKGDGFELKGKPQTKSSPKVNFTRPQGQVPAVSKNAYKAELPTTSSGNKAATTAKKPTSNLPSTNVAKDYIDADFKRIKPSKIGSLGKIGGRALGGAAGGILTLATMDEVGAKVGSLARQLEDGELTYDQYVKAMESLSKQNRTEDPLASEEIPLEERKPKKEPFKVAPKAKPKLKPIEPPPSEADLSEDNISPEDAAEIASLMNQDPASLQDIEDQVNINAEAAQMQQDKDSENRSGVKNGFKEALTFFLPELIAGLGGAVFEGSAGFLAGSEAGGQARDSFQGFQDNQRKLAQADRRLDLQSRAPQVGKPFQQSGWRLKDSKTPITYDASTNIFTDPFDPSRKITRDMVEENVQARQDQNFGLRSEQFDHNKVKDSQLTPAQLKELGQIESVASQIDRLEGFKKSVDTGPLAGRVQSYAQLADAAPEEFTKLRSQANALTLQFTKMMQGSRPSDMDLIFVQEMIPEANDNDKTFGAKLDLLTEFMEEEGNIFRESIVKGQPLKAGAVEKFARSKGVRLPKERSSSTKQSTLSMSPEQKQRLQELREKYGK